jgi:hypothetical protein
MKFYSPEIHHPTFNNDDISFDFRCFVSAVLSCVILVESTKRISLGLLKMTIGFLVLIYFAVKMFLSFGIDSPFIFTISLAFIKAILDILNPAEFL